MIEPAKIVDNMKPIEFRFKMNREFSESVLPMTKYGEQYVVVRQQDEDKIYIIDDEPKPSSNVHYYIIDDKCQVIGRFDVSGDLEMCGMTYHLVEEFQNRGIGQAALSFITNEVFEHGVSRIIILAINERSAAIALKTGFTQKSKRVFEMSQLDYQQLKSNGKALM